MNSLGSAYQGYGKQRNLYQALPTLHELPNLWQAKESIESTAHPT
ncbi:hypothetical protein [Moorena sp. SIO4G3]|nr:hypothetical protein [Moorena sp. SIO4G3]